MALKGVYVSDENRCDRHVHNLPPKSIERYTAVPKTRMVTGSRAQDKWLIIEEDYPAQMAERLKLLEARADYYIDRLPGPAVAAAEIELRERVVDYMTATYPDYFYRNGRSVTCRLTGITVRIDDADPLVTIGLMAAEDFGILLPSDAPDTTGQKNYRLSSGVLIQPSGWSLTSKFNVEAQPYDAAAHQLSLDNARLGKTSYEIHTSRVSHYAKFFADKVERFYHNMNTDMYFWRRNWGPYKTGQFSLHPDLPRDERAIETPQEWRDHGYIRSEHEGFVKLPHSKAVVFSIRTFLWKVADIEAKPEAVKALITAYDNLSPEMYEYRADRLASFGGYLDGQRARFDMPEPAAE